MTRRVIVVGAGITGTCLARELAARDGVDVTVLERDREQPRGSTAYAPGFVGLYNDAPVLTALARTSAEVYDTARAGFERRGGLELATTEDGAAEIRRRVLAANRAGLPAQLVAPDRLPAPVAAFVDVGQVVAVGSSPADGVASPTVLSRALRAQAVALGARFLTGHTVVGLEPRGPRLVVATDDGGRHRADDVVLAGGVWGPGLAGLTGTELPLFPVAHPYVYSSPAPGMSPGPFVRWPEHHVYARVHADRLGIGSYDHAPVPVEAPSLDDGARLPWDERFDEVVASARRLLRPAARLATRERVNGVFAMTPDNLPFLGPHPDLDNVWTAQALWITHAAGAARALARAMTDGTALPPEVAVDRFGSLDGTTGDELRSAALRLYRDIYANDAARGPG